MQPLRIDAKLAFNISCKECGCGIVENFFPNIANVYEDGRFRCRDCGAIVKLPRFPASYRQVTTKATQYVTGQQMFRQGGSRNA